jgi:hypothetical protein
MRIEPDVLKVEAIFLFRHFPLSFLAMSIIATENSGGSIKGAGPFRIDFASVDPLLGALYCGATFLALFMVSWVLVGPASWMLGHFPAHDARLAKYVPFLRFRVPSLIVSFLPQLYDLFLAPWHSSFLPSSVHDLPSSLPSFLDSLSSFPSSCRHSYSGTGTSPTATGCLSSPQKICSLSTSCTRLCN